MYVFTFLLFFRLHLKGSESAQHGQLNILQRLTKDGSISNEAPGLVLKYLVDPAYMQEGESRVFGRYLLSQNIHLDVWDGDSLLLIGSAQVELKVGLLSLSRPPSTQYPSAHYFHRFGFMSPRVPLTLVYCGARETLHDGDK